MTKTKMTKRKYHSMEEEEEVMRQMEERRKETEEAKKRPEEKEEQAGDTAPPLKKKKRDKKTIKTMTKKHSEECKEERKAKAQKQKKEQEEKEQEKARLKREAHKEGLKKAKELLSRTAATSTMVHAEDVPTLLATPSEPSTSRQEDPLETSLVESDPQLVSLNPFEEGEEEVIRPTSMGAARVLSQMISIEGDVPKPRKVIAGKEPRSAGLKPAGSKTVASKEPRSAGPKSAGPRSAGLMSAGMMPAGPKTAGGRPPRPTVGGKAPRKQVVPQKKNQDPGLAC